MLQLSFLHSIHYPSRLSGSDFQSFPHCPVGSTHSITGNKCHSRVTPNGGSGISAIQDMTFLSQRLIPCYDLRPRWTHNTLPCPRALCYIPRLELLTNGGVNAAFRYTDNVGFQDHQNFGAYNLHFHCGLVSHPPSFTSACYQAGCGVQF